jgi:hypothetical protein
MKTRRRAFLKRLPAAVGAGLATPTVIAAADAARQAPAAQPSAGITTEMLGVAQQIAGVSLPVAERESARSLVARNLANIEAIRKVTIASETEPAFSFKPTLDGNLRRFRYGQRRGGAESAGARRWQRPAGRGGERQGEDHAVPKAGEPRGVGV